MNLIQPIREGLESALEYVSEGWASLKQRATHAMTRFYPASRDDGDVDVPLVVHADNSVTDFGA